MRKIYDKMWDCSEIIAHVLWVEAGGPYAMKLNLDQGPRNLNSV